jgi:hypothetical protein
MLLTNSENMVTNTRKAKIEQVKEKHESELMGLQDVVGVAIGGRGKKPCIMVYVKRISPKLVKAIPKKLEGFEVRIEETGEFKALTL